jgi:hypothetical protein
VIEDEPSEYMMKNEAYQQMLNQHRRPPPSDEGNNSVEEEIMRLRRENERLRQSLKERENENARRQSEVSGATYGRGTNNPYS